YKGNVKKNKANTELLVEGEEGSEFVKIIINNRRYNKLAQLWVSGVELDWNLLYMDDTPSRIPVPTYPFAKESYWIPESSVPINMVGNSNGHAVKLHPLVSSNVSNLKEQKFSTLLMGNEFYLSDHVVADQKVLPGVAYIEMARAAGYIAGETKVQRIKNIVWSRPIAVTGGSKDVDISLYPNQNCVDYVVRTRNGDNQNVSHAQGKLIYEREPQSKSENIDIESIKNRCSDIIKGEACYNLFNATGLQYGPSFKSIQEINHNGIEALSFLELPSECKDSFAEYELHPSLMDGALQTVMGVMVSSTVGDTPYLPFALGEVEVLKPLSEKCYAYVTQAEKPSTTSATVKKFNIQLIDEQGQVLVGMKDFFLRALQPAKVERIASKAEAPETLYFKNVWEEAANNATIQDAKDGIQDTGYRIQDAGSILIFDISTDLYDAFKLKQNNNELNLILVKPGSSYKDLGDNVYEINPGARENYDQLLKSLNTKENFPNKIIHNWSQESFAGTGGEIKDQLDQGIYSIFYLSQILMKQKPKEETQLLYIYPGSEDNLHPQYAGLSGLARTIGLENRKFIYKTIEIDREKQKVTPLKRAGSTLCFEKLKDEEGETVGTKEGNKPDGLLDIILDEFQTEDGVEIRYKEGHRYVKRLKEFTFDREKVESVYVKEDGVYLITGGVGGLGLIFAEYFARQANVKLVLTGRSDLSTEKASKIKELESLGSQVIYIKADISSPEDVEDLITQIKSRFKKIDGIIHSAGVNKDAYILKKTQEEIESILAPKVYGTVYLDEATKGENLSFFVMFSSMTSVFGNAGQSDYAYANSFMDNFAEVRETLRVEKKRTGKTLSINWPLWREGGMGVDEETEKFMQKTMGIKALSTEEGLQAFAKGLSFDGTQFVVVEGDGNKLRLALGFIEASRLRRGGSDKVKAKRILGPDIHEQEVKADRGDILRKIQKDLVGIVSDILSVSEEDIDLEDDMQEYGFDSISLTEFANRVNDKYDIVITPAIFFELDYPSIGSFADYLWSDYKENFIRYYETNLQSLSPKQEEVNIQLPEDTFESEVSKISIKHRFGSAWDVKDQYQEERAPFTSDQIAIIGMSGVMPQSDDLEVFWSYLEEGRDLITEFPEGRCAWQASLMGGFMKEVDKFDCRFFGISPREAETMDPQQRIFLETVWKTIEDSGYRASDLSGTKTGIFVGVGSFDYTEILRTNPAGMESHVSTGNAHSILANRISYLLNLHGPSEPIDTACSSSLIAIHRAVSAIGDGTCEMAIAGGVNVLLNPMVFMAFNMAGMLSPDGKCKTFDKRADGYVRGEGSGAIFLKPLSRAKSDGDHIYAVIKGTSENHGGRANSLTAPNAKAQTALLIDVYERAQIDPSTVSYIEVHGTGTSLGDPVEINGLKKAFVELYKREDKPIPEEPHCGIGTVKTNIGHLETAAGIAGIIKVLLSMKNQKLPGTVHFEEVNPYIELKDTPFYIVEETMPWECLLDDNDQEIPRRAGVSSFGFGGANAHVVLEEYEELVPQSTIKSQVPKIIVMSAKTEERLKAYVNEMISFLGDPSVSFIDFAYTLQVGREPMEERLAVVAESAEELSNKLSGYIKNRDVEELYIGSVRDNKKRSNLLSQDEDAKEIIDSWIEKRKFSKIAQLWVEGVGIDWKLLYPDHTPSRISVPTYPFARERYWVQESSTAVHTVSGGNGHTAKLHPLIDRVVPTLPNQGTVFHKTLQCTDLIVKDHKVGGQCILPGVGYLEMAQAAITQINTNHNYNISRTVWLHPLLVADSKKDVEIIVKEEGKKLLYEIRSCNDTHTITHARGEYRVNGNSKEINVQHVSIDDIKSRCTQEFDKESLYVMFDGIGINYGTYFQTLKQIHYNEEEALGVLSLPSSHENELNEYTLHPTLMDGAFQTIAGLAISESRTAHTSPMVPFGVEEVEVLAPLTSPCYSYVKLAGQQRYHVAILDETGQVCIKLHDVSLREIKDVSLNDSKGDEDRFAKMFFIPKWKPAPLSSTQTFAPKTTENKSEKRTILIICPLESAGIEQKLAAAYSEDDVIEIKLGTKTKQYSKRTWEIKTDDPLTLDSCVGQLNHIDIIYFLGGIETGDINTDDLNALEQSQEQGVFSLFRLIKSLSKHGFTKHPVKLKVITNDVHQLTSEEATKPYSSSLHGFTKAMAKEYPKFDISCMDISLEQLESDTLITAIITEPGSKLGEEIVIRNNERYVRSLESVLLPPVNETLFKKGGVYIILGGAGGIGLELSKYLAERMQARLVLIGRSELNADQKEKIKGIESKGSEVL
ncbi:MAG: SDR family NAD(P)-dependent oxidoreductase, partial [bacterium]|nr:SDR family NAD(P)-dependent oxidoreductase [bacterium]